MIIIDFCSVASIPGKKPQDKTKQSVTARSPFQQTHGETEEGEGTLSQLRASTVGHVSLLHSFSLSFHMKNIQRPPPPPAGQTCRVPPGCRTAFIYSYCSLDSKKIVKKIKGGQASSECRWLPLLSEQGRESSGPETRAVDETVGGLECSSPQQSNF